MSRPWFPCARCGRPVRRVAKPGRLEIRCPRCRYLMFDYPRPAAGMIVLRGADCLMLRRGAPPKLGYLDVPGGFLEADESIERAARRELEEETGLTVGRVRPLGFYWDRYYLKGFGRFPTMNFYFLARWRSGAPVAADDAASAEWVPLAGLGHPGQRLAWRHMVRLFADVKALAAGRRRMPRNG